MTDDYRPTVSAILRLVQDETETFAEAVFVLHASVRLLRATVNHDAFDIGMALSLPEIDKWVSAVLCHDVRGMA